MSEPETNVLPARKRRLHPAWIVAAVAFLALVGAAGFRAAPGVLMVPLQEEFGWSTTVLSAAVSINLVLFGLTAPFAAALMERFGIRAVTSVALVLIGAGSALTVLVDQAWQILLTWGLLIGLGTGSMALVFAATIANTWFAKSRGLVIGILTAGSAAGQLVFLPAIAVLAQDQGWRQASLLIAAGALAVVPLVLKFLKNSPAEAGVRPYGAEDAAEDAARSAEPERCRACPPGAQAGQQGPDLLGPRRRVRHLRCHDQRTDRDALHPLRPRPRDGTNYRRRAARRRRDL
jgi:MFS family permease